MKLKTITLQVQESWDLISLNQNNKIKKMKTSHLLYITILSIFAISCNDSTTRITQKIDYNSYLTKTDNTKTVQIFKELNFWNTKLDPDSTRIKPLGSIAKNYTNLFQATGNIDYLKKAEKVLTKSIEIAAINKEKYQLSLSGNYISQHRFKEAKKMAMIVFETGNFPLESQMVLFDVSMELGDYKKAETYLSAIEKENDYNFLIRLAKWNDYKGNLDNTIIYMEKAKEIAEKSNRENLELWSYTNLADYYGHAGRIKDSYQYYLKALEIDPSNAYAQKGIAWIAYSYENNPKEALRILTAIAEKYTSPDQSLLMAEISAYMNDTLSKDVHIKKYLAQVSNVDYGVMYDKYNTLLYAEELGNYDLALTLAKNEVTNRSTPESFDLLAYTLFLKGEYKKALDIIEEYVDGKTYEPEIMYHMAKIYKANNKMDQVTSLKKELLESSYELGPVVTNEIAKL